MRKLIILLLIVVTLIVLCYKGFYALRYGLTHGETHEYLIQSIFEEERTKFINELKYINPADIPDSTFYFMKYFPKPIVIDSKDYIVMDTSQPYDFVKKVNIDSITFTADIDHVYMMYKKDGKIDFKMKTFKLEGKQKELTYMGVWLNR